jgi:FkbM family methyltransferase
MDKIIQDELKWLCNSGPEAEELYNEVIAQNVYGVSYLSLNNREVIDIGANMGMFSIFASKLGAKKVIAVEPISSTVELFNQHIKKAEVNNITVKQNIVSDISNQTVKIGLQDKCGHNSVYSPSDKFEEIKTITIKELVALTYTDNIFLKIDCEGGEYDIFLNADPLDMAKISTIAIEIHGDLHPKYKGVWRIHKALFDFGFIPIQQKQMKAWNADQFGNVINTWDLPTTEEIWVRNE